MGSGITKITTLTVRIGDQVLTFENQRTNDPKLRPLLNLASKTATSVVIDIPPSEQASNTVKAFIGAEPPPEELLKKLCKRIDELELSTRLGNCLRNTNYVYIWQIVERQPKDFLRLKNLGVKSLTELEEVLYYDLDGLYLGMDLTKIKPYLPRP